MRITEDIRNQSVRHTNSCFFTMVAVDGHGKSVPVPPLDPQTAEERRRFAQAQQRRQIRRELESRYQAIKDEV